MAEYLTQEEIDALGLKSQAPEMRALSQSFKEVPIRFPSSPESWRKTIQKAGVSIPGGIREWAAGGVLGIADLLGLEGLQRIAQRNVAEAQTEGMPEAGLSRDIVQRGVVGAGHSAGMMLPSLLLRGTNMTRPQQIAAGAAMIAPGIYGSEREDLNPLPAAGSALLQGAVEQAVPLPFLKPMGGGLANILKDYGIRTGGEVAEEIPQYMIHEAFRGRAPTLEGIGETTKEAIIPSAILTALTGAMPMRRRQAMGERFIPQPEAVRPEQKPAQPQTEQQEQPAKNRKGDMAPPPAEFGFEEQRQEQKVLTKPIENQVEIPAQAIVGHEEQNTIQQDTALPDADAQQIEQQVTPESRPITADSQPPQAVNHAKLKRVVDPSRHTLLQAIALEGVDATDPLANDLRVSLGIDQNKNMRVPVPGGPPVWLFRKDGKRIDTIAGDLSQGSSAYLSTHDRQELLEKLYDNPEYLTPQGMESRARQEFEERQAEEMASATEKFEAAIAARNIEDESTEAELDWILNNGRIMTEEEANTFNREFMEALNADTTATETAFRNEARGIEAGGPNSAQAQEDYSLETQTEESIAAAEQKNANAASIAANEAAPDEIRMTAEAMPLSPTGSDRAADANPNKDDIFRGLRQKNAPYTTDLFGEPVAVPSAAKPTKQRIPGDADRTSALSRDDSEGTFATKTKLVTENKRAIGARQVITQEDAANALAYLGKGAVERFDGLVTDDNGKPLAIVGAFKGAISQTSVYPSTVAGEAFRIKDAAHIWFAHNHPSGNAEFSGADRGLNRQLMEVFRGSGIKAHGLFAIAGSAEGNRKWVFTDGEQDSTGNAKTSKAAVIPVVERVYSKNGYIGDAISSPEKAKSQIGKISAGQSGIVLLDAQNRPIGFVQIAPEDTAPLRTRGRMDAIYRAISIANASAGMVVNNGHYNTDQARNLTGLLNSLDVRALDVLDATSDGMRSWAERGYGMASTFYSRADTSQQKKHTKTTLTRAIDKAFGNGFTGRLEGTGKFKFITAEQAKSIVGEKAAKAWHGSPHDHDKFDSSKIGTGEGNQAFGFGLYFASSREVAEYYRDHLIDSKFYDDINAKLSSLAAIMSKDSAGGYRQFKSQAGKDAAEEYDRLLEERARKKNRLYQVELAPEPDEYLDWDKPLSEQSEKVKSALYGGDEVSRVVINKFVDGAWGGTPGKPPGSFLYETLSDKLGGDKAASEYLHSIGIRGIRYLDGSSRDMSSVKWSDGADASKYDRLTKGVAENYLRERGDVADAIRRLKADAKASGAKQYADAAKALENGDLAQKVNFNYVIFDDADVKIEAKYSKNGEILAFVKDGITHLVTDNIGLAENIKGLVLHEIGVHALTLGKNDPQFKAITRRLEALRKAGDKKAQAARNKVPDDTPEGDVLEEQLGYYVQANPDLSIAKQAIAWLRAMLRKLGANLSGLEKTRWVQWSNSLTADDMIYMATAVTKKAPNALASQGNKEGARFSKQDAELEENYGKAAGDGSQQTTKILQEAAELGRDDWFVAKRGVVPHGETKDASDALAARTGYNYDAIREALADGGQPAATIIGAGMAANRMQVANAIVAARNGDFSGMVSSLADAINTAIGVRVAMSEFARAMSYYGWAMKQGAEKLDQQEASQKTRDSSKDMLKKTGKLLSDEDIIKMLGGRKQVDVIMGKLGRDDINLDAISRFLSGMSGAMAMENTRTTTGKISSGILEYWKANILSGLFTHEVNITGNALSIALEEAAIKPIGAAIGSIRGEGQNLSDQARAAKAITGIWGNALAMAKFAAKQEYPGKQLAQIATMDQKMAPLALTTLENKWRSPAALPGFIGRTVRNYGYTPLGMEDAFAKAIVYQLELARSNGNIEQALLEADRQTFNERLHGLHGKLSHAIQGTALEFVFPFTKTLANLVKAGLRMTPGINMAVPSYREELSGKLGPSIQNDAIARMIVGSALSAAIAALHGGDDPEDEGALSGLGPATGARRKIWLQENSPLGLNAGDVSFPMYRFDPFSTQAGVTIAVIDAQSAYNAFKNGKITEDEWVQRNGDAAKSVSRVVLDKHFMANAAGILESLSEPSRIPQSAKRGLTGFVTGMIPMAGMLGQTAQMLDPYKHKPDDVVGTFHSRIPGLRNDLDPMLDVWGQQVEEPRYASPFPTQAVRRKGDPVNKELLKLGMGIGIPKWMDALSYGERKELLEQRKEMFDEAILSPDWEQMDREDQRTMIRTIQRKWSSQHSELRNELKADGKIK